MPSFRLTVAIVCASGALSATLYSLYSRKRSKLPLPPGPAKLPLVGNLFDLPADFQWEKYMEWSKKYDSDIIHLDLAGTSVIVLSSWEATTTLLEKRSSSYSDRAELPMVTELMGWDFNIAFMKYGDTWRTNRRLMNRAFNAKAARQYRPRELAATHALLQRLLNSPDAFFDHFFQMAGELIMAVAYGIDILPSKDPYIALAHDAGHTLLVASFPGRFLVNTFPMLKYVPSWFPGAGFKRQAQEWKQLARAMIDTPFAETKRQMASGTAPRSFTADNLHGLSDDLYYQEQHVKSTAATMYSAGADTTISALGTFVLAMLACPDAQRRAQAEIDSVTGGKYLPDFDDEAAMPYVSALVKEVLRWKNVTPIAIPHLLTVDDEYRGYRLPAGSMIIGNTWAILHDEAMYPDPYAFKPERFLIDGKPNPAVRDPDVAFGFGRRVCPGRHLATSSVWITVVSLLATFDIQKALDEMGNIIEPTGEYVSGLVSAPLPFKCSITPRSESAVALIQGIL
ncbi:cytochrome P450 [Mycena rosella]|uniref:Cytochrome P450 n=1 Tax=Mycena rosella TaxID=1033263 RepID=A0AAD7DQC1_MYCRO|nr:cytochrome P450 [Mycena rosella]